MMENIAIKLNQVSMAYKLYASPKDRMKEALHPLRRKFHEIFYALNDVSFDIFTGQTVGIIGKNGAGKSTILKLISHVLQPSAGNVDVSGSVSSLLELGIGFNPSLTGIENIHFYSSILGFKRHETEERINEIIAFADIGRFIYQPLRTYSQGMRARLAFAVATTVDPDILIIDEVLSVGDAAFRRKCSAKLEQFKEKGKTILLVSHSEDTVINICERVIWLHDGRIVLDGSPNIVTGLYLKYGENSPLPFSKIQYDFENLKTSEPLENEKQQRIPQKTILPAFYDAKLKPKSTIRYESQGAIIKEIQIKDHAGRQVNVLTTGERYHCTYTVEFLTDCEVNFGLLIKTSEGIELGGGQFPGVLTFHKIAAYTNLAVDWTFDCNLHEGIYVMNAGVLSRERMYLHRVLDIAMFRVRQREDNLHNVGTVNMNFTSEIRHI